MTTLTWVISWLSCYVDVDVADHSYLGVLFRSCRNPVFPWLSAPACIILPIGGNPWHTLPSEWHQCWSLGWLLKRERESPWSGPSVHGLRVCRNKGAFFGRWLSGILVTRTARLTWAFWSSVLILGMPARVRSSMYGTMYCHLMLTIRCISVVGKWLSGQVGYSQTVIPPSHRSRGATAVIVRR